MRSAMSKLFREETDVRELIKLEAIDELLESISDRCEDVANLIEGVVLEHSYGCAAWYSKKRCPEKATVAIRTPAPSSKASAAPMTTAQPVRDGAPAGLKRAFQRSSGVSA
jgi:hypothetical protein